MNRHDTKSKPINSWMIDKQTAGPLRAAVEDFRPVIICFTPKSKHCCSRVTCEFRKVSMGEIHYIRNPKPDDPKFEIVGPRKPLDPWTKKPSDSKKFMVWFVPIEGITQKVMIRLYWHTYKFIIPGNEIIFDEFSNVSWVVRDKELDVVTDFELS